MVNSLSTMLRCGNCGHEWRPRNTEGKSRQCSRCRSRRISVVEDVRDTGGGSPSQATRRPSAGTVPGSSVNIHPMLADDPDIIAKLKELELARLDSLIAEKRQTIEAKRATLCLADYHIRLIDMLRALEVIDDETCELLLSLCPYCGHEGDEGMGFDSEKDEYGKWSSWYQCRSCGVRIAV